MSGDQGKGETTMIENDGKEAIGMQLKSNDCILRFNENDELVEVFNAKGEPGQKIDADYALRTIRENKRTGIFLFARKANSVCFTYWDGTQYKER
jgi:hypothetical protein